MFTIDHLKKPEFLRLMAESGNYSEGPMQIEAARQGKLDVSPSLLGVPNVAKMIIGVLTDEDQEDIHQFLLRDIENEEEHAQCIQILEKLRGRSRESNSPLLNAYIISFDLNIFIFASIRGFLSADEGNEAQISALIEEGYSTYSDLLDAFLQLPIHDHNLLASTVNGLIHFWEPYRLLTDPTEKNCSLVQKLLAKLLGVELKILPKIPPEELGNFFTVPGMIRELVIHSAIKFSSANFDDLITTALGIYDEYVASTRVFEERRQHVNLVLNSQRTLVDFLMHDGLKTFLESVNKTLPDYLEKVICKSTYLGLLNDTARLLLMNTFGSSREIIDGQEGVLHIRFVYLNEASTKACVVITKESQCHICLCAVSYLDLNKLANLLAKACFDEDPAATDKAVELLQAVFTEETLALLSEIKNVSMVTIYPDGILWRLPWQWLVWALPNVFPKSGLDSLNGIPVVIKIGERSLQPKPEVRNVLLIAGWNYQNPEEQSTQPRRGMAQRGVIPNLPGVKKEVDNIRSFLPTQWQASIIDNPDDKGVLEAMANMAHPGIVHLACHGGWYDSNSLPKIVMPSRRQSEPISFLHFESILRVPWSNCHLLFLNACFGGAGRPHVGGLPSGLHEAFLIAGVHNFLAPLWPVYDDVATEFAETFYTNFVASKDLFTSYRDTMVSLISGSDSRCVASAIAYQMYAM